jgi:hypothetical protein
MIEESIYTTEPRYEIGADVVINDKIATIVDILQGQKGLWYLLHYAGHYSAYKPGLEIQHEMYLQPAPEPKFTYKNRVDILNPDGSVRKRNVRVNDKMFIEGVWMYFLDYEVEGGSTWWAEKELQKYRRKVKNGPKRESRKTRKRSDKPNSRKSKKSR